MKKLFLLLLFITSINAHAQQKSGAQQFWDLLKQHCGKAYQGEVTQGMTDTFKNGPLVMHVRKCSDGLIKIPFFVGDDKSRTWVLTLKDDRILLKHDHRHVDGSEDKVTQYGGLTSNSGTANLQIFPADQQTVDLLPAAVGNVWWITIDGDSFTYNLRRIGSDRIFTVKFDLSKPVATPAAPWGWKD
ncbi:MAG: hypothetical protein REI64_04685 [Pedobacter sp.]|uniref:hypothetical protein n=1 Tax=Pedobacter sp. TaxID=1411316 RepID=UPI0028092F56|nr:hypothetical protein [Pedobacter sp.]MDQ8004075.1 hypothetical protein [Pedobacter sp.]